MIDSYDKFMIGDDVPLSLNDPLDIVASDEFTSALYQILKRRLNRRERFICIRRYVYSESFRKIGEHLHIGHSQVIHLLSEICRKLRYTDELIDLYKDHYYA